MLAVIFTALLCGLLRRLLRYCVATIALDPERRGVRVVERTTCHNTIILNMVDQTMSAGGFSGRQPWPKRRSV